MENTKNFLGYRMPAEWDKHDATWLAWPKNKNTWPKRIGAVERIYLEMIKALHEKEKVNILVDDEKAEEYVKNKLAENNIADNIFFYKIKTVDAWLRDTGPIFVFNDDIKEIAMVQWNFNAWGMKYPATAKDASVNKKINDFLQMTSFSPNMILEGGSIDVNGKGTLLTTEQCLLNKNRNPNLKKEEIEQYLKDYLGVTKILWLCKGIVGDDTDGHVDDMIRFVNKNTVLCAFEDDVNDENYEALQKNYEILKNSTDQDGKELIIVKFPMPGKVYADAKRLPASYSNFYIGNSVVVVPVFGHENDEKALEILKSYFPDRKIVGINCTDMVYGYGALHCVTQQQPGV